MTMPNDAEFMHEMQQPSILDRSTPEFISFIRDELNRLAFQRQVVFNMPSNGATIVVDRSMHHARV